MPSTDPAEFFAAPPAEVAPRLLGSTLRWNGVTLRITEVEAYGGGDDPGSHAHKGLRPRCRSLFEAGGTVYVYLSYGMHHCVNLVCGDAGVGGGCLLRAAEVISGEQIALERRNATTLTPSLASGPGRLGQCLGVDLGDDGTTLANDADPLWTAPPTQVEFTTGPRVGLRPAAQTPWRFWIPDDPTVSTYRPAAPARRRRTSST